MTSQEPLNEEFSKETTEKIIKACPVKVGDLVYWSFSEEQAKNPTDVRLVIGLGIFKADYVEKATGRRLKHGLSVTFYLYSFVERRRMTGPTYYTKKSEQESIKDGYHTAFEMPYLRKITGKVCL